MRIPGPKQLVAVGAVALVLAACGGSDSEGSSYTEPTGPAVANVKLDSGNIFFKPKQVTASPPGIIDVTLENIEGGVHDLVIRDVPGFQIEVSGEGDTVSKKVKLEKGKYEFYCTITGHEEAGMKGTLTVS
jgi:plastocyanin